MEHVAPIVLRSSILIKSLSFVYLYFDVCWLSAIYSSIMIKSQPGAASRHVLPCHSTLFSMVSYCRPVLYFRTDTKNLYQCNSGWMFQMQASSTTICGWEMHRLPRRRATNPSSSYIFLKRTGKGDKNKKQPWLLQDHLATQTQYLNGETRNQNGGRPAGLYYLRGLSKNGCHLHHSLLPSLSEKLRTRQTKILQEDIRKIIAL